MKLTSETVQNVVVVTVIADQLDASNADDFKREIGPVLPTSARLVLDLGQVQFIDSSGCGAILSCLKALTGHGGDLKLCRIVPTVRNVFKLIRLDKICDLFDTREAAVKAFTPAAK